LERGAKLSDLREYYFSEAQISRSASRERLLPASCPSRKQNKMVKTDLSARVVHQRNAEHSPHRQSSETGATSATKREPPPFAGMASVRFTEASTMTHPTSAGAGSLRFETRSELERALHQLGLPKSAAKKVVAGGWPALSRQQPADDYRPFQREISDMSVQSLRERKIAKQTEIEALNSKKDWNETTDKPIFDALMADLVDVNARIERINVANEVAANQFTNKPVAQGADTEHWATSAGPIPVMRKGCDFKSFYPAENRNEQPITMSDFLRGISGQKMTEGVRNALSEGTNSSGGYAVPTELFPQILQAMVPVSTLLQAGAGIVDVTQTPAKQFNTAAISVIPTAAWRSEAGAVAESDPTFRNVPAVPQSLSFFIKLSRELLADAVNLEPALQTTIAQAFAKEIDRVGLRGAGTPPEPTGLLNTSGIQAVGNGTNGSSIATTAYANFISAIQALLAADAPKPSAFIMAPRTLTTLAGLLDSQNNARRAPPMVSDIPFLATSQIPINLTVGTSSDCSEIYTGDFTKMVYVMRERPSIQVAKELYAATGQLCFICHARLDVAVMYPAAFAAITGVRA
jgi:HK97 family phage major capsid protein